MAKNKITSPVLPEFDIIKKMSNSNAVVDELRTGIWAPIEKISNKSLTSIKFEADGKKRTLQTSWGKMVVKGNILTQTHRDLLDCIIVEKIDIVQKADTGGIAIYFNAANVLRRYGVTTTNVRWLKSKLDQIQTTAIEFTAADSEDTYSFNILGSWAYSQKKNMFYIEFTKQYIEYVEKNLTVNYLSNLDQLLEVKSPLIKAIIRFFWTHSISSTMEIEEMLRIVGFPVESPRAKMDAKKEIKNNSEIFESFGVTYDRARNLIYRKNSVENEITFIPAKNSALIKMENKK